MTRLFHKILIYFSALLISGVAASFSIFGLGKLFAGYSLYVMIMAGSIELAKIIILSLVFKYWVEIKNIFLKGFILLCFILALFITSMGVYGFLTSAYQQSLNKFEISNKSIGLHELKNKRFIEQRNDIQSEVEQLLFDLKEKNRTISNLRNIIKIEDNSISQRTTQTRLKDTQKEISELTIQKNNLAYKLQSIEDSITKSDILVLNMKSADETSTELGPLYYISNLTGKPMNEIVNWLVLLLIFVFDPLAICLIIFVNQLPNKKNNIISENNSNFINEDNNTCLFENITEPNTNKKFVDNCNDFDPDVIQEPCLHIEPDKNIIPNEPDIYPDNITEPLIELKSDTFTDNGIAEEYHNIEVDMLEELQKELNDKKVNNHSIRNIGMGQDGSIRL